MKNALIDASGKGGVSHKATNDDTDEGRYNNVVANMKDAIFDTISIDEDHVEECVDEGTVDESVVAISVWAAIYKDAEDEHEGGAGRRVMFTAFQASDSFPHKLWIAFLQQPYPPDPP